VVIEPLVAPVTVPAPPSVPFTVCVLLYGDYLDMIKRCLLSIKEHIPPEFAKVRIGMNEVSPRVRDWVWTNMTGDHITVFDSPKNIFKYPLMRRMFNEPLIDTEWVMWLDDDSHIVDPQFVTKLSKFLAENPYDYVGNPYIYTWLAPGQVQWVKEADWYGGKPPLTRMKNGQTKYTVDFATGGFWCIRAEVVRALDWPDKRIGHNFGDVSLGEAIRQNDYRFGKFYEGVAISDCERRGASQRHPGR
jgi:GT2 family glycosyltransferase